MRFLRPLIAVALAALLLAIAVLSYLPLAPLVGGRLPAGVTVLEGSSPLRGRALVAVAGGGTDRVRWRWCPGGGPLNFCTHLAGHSGVADAGVTLHSDRLVLTDLTFSGVSSDGTRVQNSPFRATLAGELERLVVPTGGCPLRGLRPGPGEIRLTELRLGNRPLSPHRLSVAPARDGTRLTLAGEQATGELKLTREGRLRGRLRMSTSSGDTPLEIDWQLPCGALN